MTRRELSDEDRANLVAYLDGELDERAARALEAKLSLDAAARAEAEVLRRTWELLDYLPRPAPSANFAHRTLERIAAPPTAPAAFSLRGRCPPWALAVGWVAAIVLAGTTGFTAARIWSRQHPGRSQAAENERQLVQDLPVIENLRLYEHVDDIQFLRLLAKPNDPDLFGDDHFEP